MAAGDSIVSICNIALIALGESVISSLNDPTRRAILCKTRYDDVRRATLRTHPWNCAKKQAQLAASNTAPLFNYTNAFPLPVDCLRLLDLPDNDQAVWEVQGNQVLTDEGAPLNIVYVFDLQDPTQFDPELVHSLAYALAQELAQPLTQNQAKVDQTAKMRAAKLDDARLVTSQENSPREWDEDIWLRSRI